MKPSRPKSDGFRLTKVGLWFFLFLLIVLVAATNTGNNGLFLALAVMGAALVVSHFLAGFNVRGMSVDLEPPGEIFANSPASITVEIANRSWFPRWLLLLTIDPEDVEPPSARRRLRVPPLLIPFLGRKQKERQALELLVGQRGRHRIGRVHVSSLFPLGFFRKGRRAPVDLEMLVFPEIFSPSAVRPEDTGKGSDDSTRRVGWGHDLFGLRSFRHGDDPRGIHWKQTARTGNMVFKEREAEERRRLLIVFDNAVGEFTEEGERRRFERLVSEAATAALDHLASGYEVALSTRDEWIPFASGAWQRHRILEVLALVEALSEATGPLAGLQQAAAPGTSQLRLAMDRRPAQASDDTVEPGAPQEAVA